MCVFHCKVHFSCNSTYVPNRLKKLSYRIVILLNYHYYWVPTFVARISLKFQMNHRSDY